LLDDNASAISMAGAFFYREPARIFILQVTAIELMMLRMKLRSLSASIDHSRLSKHSEF
jgi:hypothetical protein